MPFRFETETEARKFAESEGINGVLPIDTGKHVYYNWAPIMQKRGAVHPKFDPFKFEENKNLQSDYHRDMCPKTLDLLSRTVYIPMNPDWTEEEINALIEKIRAAK